LYRRFQCNQIVLLVVEASLGLITAPESEKLFYSLQRFRFEATEQQTLVLVRCKSRIY